MKLARKLLVATSVIALLGVAVLQGSVAAQIGYTPDDPVIERVGSGKVDFDGKFSINYTAAPKVNDPHLIYVLGTDEDGEEFEWLALQITEDQSGEGVTIEGSNLQPGSNYGLEARYDGQTLEDGQIEEAASLVAESSEAEINIVPIGTTGQTVSSDTDVDADTDIAGAAGDDDDEEVAAGPTTSGSDGGSGLTGVLIGFVILVAVVLGAIAYGRRLRTRHL